jgi:curved DNA-binding protein CbpA
MDYHQCCNVLDLVPPVRLEDAKQAYKDLVQVWHPDRFTHSPRLQERAEAKLKQLNLAYETLVPLLQAQQKLRQKRADRRTEVRTPDRSPSSKSERSPDPQVWNVASTFHDAMRSKTWFDRLSLATKARIYGLVLMPGVVVLVFLMLQLAMVFAAYPQLLAILVSVIGFYYALRKLSDYSSRS